MRVPVLRLPLDLPLSQTPAIAQDAQDLTGHQELVVDNIGTNRRVVSTYLGFLGWKAVDSATGASASTRLPCGSLIDLMLLEFKNARS
jgi:hypothetical protein